MRHQKVDAEHGRSASKIGSSTSIAAVMQTRSRKVEMPSGRSFAIGLRYEHFERLFQVGRDKLMMVPAFARCYEFLMSWRVYFETLAVWQAMLRWARAIKERGHRMLAFGESWLASLKRKGG